MGWVGATIWHAGRTALVVTQTHENLFHALFHAVPMRKARDLDHVTCLDLNRLTCLTPQMGSTLLSLPARVSSPPSISSSFLVSSLIATRSDSCTAPLTEAEGRHTTATHLISPQT